MSENPYAPPNSTRSADASQSGWSWDPPDWGRLDIVWDVCFLFGFVWFAGSTLMYVALVSLAIALDGEMGRGHTPPYYDLVGYASFISCSALALIVAAILFVKRRAESRRGWPDWLRASECLIASTLVMLPFWAVYAWHGWTFLRVLPVEPEWLGIAAGALLGIIHGFLCRRGLRHPRLCISPRLLQAVVSRKEFLRTSLLRALSYAAWFALSVISCATVAMLGYVALPKPWYESLDENWFLIVPVMTASFGLFSAAIFAAWLLFKQIITGSEMIPVRGIAIICGLLHGLLMVHGAYLEFTLTWPYEGVAIGVAAFGWPIFWGELCFSHSRCVAARGLVRPQIQKRSQYRLVGMIILTAASCALVFAIYGQLDFGVRGSVGLTTVPFLVFGTLYSASAVLSRSTHWIARLAFGLAIICYAGCLLSHLYTSVPWWIDR